MLQYLGSDPYYADYVISLCSGMDPVVFAALCGVGSGIVGFALGGVLFTNTWRIMFRRKAKELQKVNAILLS